MKECLHCKKQFQEKKDTAKYCSDSCRVMFNRNKPKVKKEGITELKMEVLYNAMLDWVSKVNFVPPTIDAYNGTKQQMVHADESALWATEPKKPKIVRSKEYFQRMIINGFELPEEHMAFIDEVNESDLSPKTKQDLITASRVKQF